MLKRVQEILGVGQLRSEHDLARVVESRLGRTAIGGLLRWGLTDDEVYLLIVPRRTLSHRRARREPLSRDESDRAVRLARVLALAERVFGDRERAWRWLRSAKRRFDGRTPLQFTVTEAGARLVEELLYSIDEGMAAQVDLWRISNHASLAGDGGLRAAGRWHTRGHRVVSCAESRAAALLEILVHFEIELRDLPVRYRLLRISVPDEFPMTRVRVKELPGDWPEAIGSTRAVGDAWLQDRPTALLSVPSAIVPATFNVLLNPAHPDASRVAVVETTEHAIDRRLLK